MKQRESMLAQLDNVLEEWGQLKARSHKTSYGDIPDVEGIRFVTRALAVVSRIGGPGSAYAAHAEKIAATPAFTGNTASRLAGVVDSLRADVAAGYIDHVATLVRAEVFGDFLEMASHLVDQGYKDAAAVLAGSSLEAHLHQLCTAAEIDLTFTSGDSLQPKKADLLNSELAKKNVYAKLDQKNVTAWLDLRNKAAHGKYGEYEEGQVRLTIAGIRDFLTRVPA